MKDAFFAIMVMAVIMTFTSSNMERVVSGKYEGLSGTVSRKVVVFRNRDSVDRYRYRCLTPNDSVGECSSDTSCLVRGNGKRGVGGFGRHGDSDEVDNYCACSLLNETFYVRTRDCHFGFDAGLNFSQPAHDVEKTLF